MFGAELRRRREAAGISLRQMAKILHVSPGWLSRIELEQHEPPERLAAAADVQLGACGALMSLAAAGRAAVRGLLRPAELPSGPTEFVGRTGALHTLDTLLATAERAGSTLTVALDGPAGAGKSALAIEWAHHVAHRFPGGVLFADLRGFSTSGRAADPRRILERFLRALGAAPEHLPSADLDELAAHFRTIVSHRRTLILLDNARDHRHVRPLMTGPAGTSVVLITSRRRMTGLTVHGAAQRVPVASMAQDDALALLRSVVGDDRVNAEAEAAIALVQRCAYLPLALRIAAVRLASRPHRSIASAVQDLEDDHHRLALLADDEDVAVRSVLDGSYRELRKDVAHAYRLLGLYSGAHISTPAAAALLGRPEPVAQRLLDDLVAVHMLEDISISSTGRYRFHDLLHAYAADRAAADEACDERRAAVRRLAGWYASSVDRANFALAPQRPIQLLPPPSDVIPLEFTDAAQAAEWCDAEADNIVPLVRLAADHRLPAAWQVPARSWNWLLLRKPWTLWTESHIIALRAATAAGDLAAQAWVAMNLGEGYRQSRRYGPAREHLEQARRLRHRLGDKHGQAWCHACRGFLAIDEGAPRIAIEYFRRALTLFEETADVHGQSVVLAALAEAYDRQGSPGDATTAFETARTLARRMNDLYAEGILWFRRANAHRHRAEIRAALDCLNRSVECRRTADDAWGTAEALTLRGDVLAQLGEDGAAQRSWQEAQAAFERLGDARAAELRQRIDGALPDRLMSQ